MSDEQPSKTDISTIFKKLRLIASNKVCFDCGAKNPTWSSVTYGIFICIDCSAIHRGLGVHVSFVRSTQLDTNWTWLQLRAMQVGGNANAAQFFRQHGCLSTDAQEKYKSRAANLYKEKLHHSAVAAMRLHGYKVLIDSGHGEQLSPPLDKAEKDFFEEHIKEEQESDNENFMARNDSQVSMSEDAYIISHSGDRSSVSDGGKGPSIDLINTSMDNSDKKPAIGQRRQVTGKKGCGFGAQKLTNKNFSQIEKEAENLEKLKLQNQTAFDITTKSATDANKSDSLNTGLSSRLMVQNLAEKRDEKLLKSGDPKKFEQAERLGMGFHGNKKGISHSVAGDITSIRQEGEKISTLANLNMNTNTTNTFGGAGGFDNYSSSTKTSSIIDDDWQLVSSEPVKNNDFMKRSSNSNNNNNSSSNDFFDAFTKDVKKPSSASSFDWGENKKEEKSRAKTASSNYAPPAPAEDLTKKFANAKAISSDQYFGERAGFDVQSRGAAGSNRFEGQTSISSAEFFGVEDKSARNSAAGGYGLAAGTDMADIKDSVKQGVTRVAGKLSQFSNSVSNYISSNYN